jgi:GDPmannose 4,6-dehydratase
MKVVITGFTGQDGSNMADYLLENTNAQIYGVVRQLSVPNHQNIEHLKQESRVKLIDGDVSDPHSMTGIIEKLKPDYFINFAANSFVGTSWQNPTQVMEVNAMSVLHQLEAIRKFSPKTRYYQAGSSEEFGDVLYSPQDEKHPLRPRSPYGASKAAARHIVKVYRESYGIYAVCGWLFNHEGVRRGEQFVTRKITKGVARIYHALRAGESFKPIELGNLESKRDWSDSEDFMDGIWRMLNQDQYNYRLKYFRPNFQEELPNDQKFLVSRIKDYVLASGETHTVKEFVSAAFKSAGIRTFWCYPASPLFEGYVELHLNVHNPSVHGYDGSSLSGGILAKVNKEFYRPAEVDLLIGDSSNIRKDLRWCPKSSFQDLVHKMVTYDITLT